MNGPKLQHSYHDLQSLQQIRSTAKKDEQGALRQAAEQFEAIFFNMLLKSMRQANKAFEAEGLMNSQTTEFYRDMHDNQMATDLAQKGSLGLADILVQQLDPTAAAKNRQQAAVLQLPGERNRELAMPEEQHFTEQPEMALLQAQSTHLLMQAGVSQPGRRETSVLQPILDKLQQQRQKTAHNVKSQPVTQDLAVMQASATPWQVDSPVAFIKSLLPAARKAAGTLGLDPLALIAQAALETGWGKRMIKTANGDNSFNLFGIKASRNWQGNTAVVDTLEYRQGVARKEQAKFRAYTSPEDSLRDYTDFIANSLRYQQAVASAAEPAAYFSELQAAGYATDPNYAQKIMSVYRSTAFEQVRAELESSQDFTAAADE